MTFSVLGRDGSGGFGMAVTSSSPAVAARCLHLRSGIGGVASQNITDPRLGSLLLDRLAAGETAAQALAWLQETDETMAYRQVTVLGNHGAPAAHSGAHTLGVHHQRVGGDAVAAGNLLDNPAVIDAVLQAFQDAAGELEVRLLCALEAGLIAGGEAGEVHSAGLAVTRAAGWNVTDLRIDWSDMPVTDLRDLLTSWLPQRDDYVTRGIDPSTAPSYGVPGDE